MHGSRRNLQAVGTRRPEPGPSLGGSTKEYRWLIACGQRGAVGDGSLGEIWKNETGAGEGRAVDHEGRLKAEEPVVDVVAGGVEGRSSVERAVGENRDVLVGGRGRSG